MVRDRVLSMVMVMMMMIVIMTEKAQEVVVTAAKVEVRFFLTLDLPTTLVLASLACASEKSFHLRQPSKSMRACMQPHSMTFLSSQTKLTG